MKSALAWRRAILAAATLPLLGSALDVPSTWAAPAFNTTRAARIDTAQRGITAAVTSQNISTTSGYGMNFFDSWESAHALGSVAMADYVAGTTEYEHALISVLPTVSAGLGQGNVSDPAGYGSHAVGRFDVSQGLTDSYIEWGMTFMYAARAYNSSSLLDLAKAAWSEAATYQVSAAQAEAGAHPLRNVSFSSACNGSSVAGGVFWTNTSSNASDLQLGGIPTARFMALSAHLAELTHNTTYADAAQLAAQFIRTHLFSDDGLVATALEAGNCAVLGPYWSSYTGAAAEGFAVLGDVTDDEQWRSLARDVTIVATQSPTLADQDGILQEQISWGSMNPDERAYKGQHVQSLYFVWERNTANATFAPYIEAYIAVQYNALLATSSPPGSVYYGSSWTPSNLASSFSSSGILASVPVLAAAIGPANATTGTDPDAGINNSRAPKRTPSAALIVGAVVAGIVAVTIGGILALYLRRRHRRRTPFTYVAPPTAGVPGGSLVRARPEPAPVFRPRSAAKGRSSTGPAEHAVAAAPDVPVPVAQLVELLYQRLQADRPAYDLESVGLPAYEAPPESGHARDLGRAPEMETAVKERVSMLRPVNIS